MTCRHCTCASCAARNTLEDRIIREWNNGYGYDRAASNLGLNKYTVRRVIRELVEAGDERLARQPGKRLKPGKYVGAV
ncbi:helix-turn-helix domain-containing protein [Parvularcula flava]|uniref:Helix-turn-helix domain-containing protein n=1 Tax=Aquisalinus luteolus TaxID=1566827 RepID=A0A8J3A5S5_9PROT|nr:helix-turn-helix domain-containing protein [Aquisalinus luteolus]NHK29171.1 helix-turn-helix domain-containing protein [Aquisalinus luteolus]GGI00090.1 hypothetical protein GCM10011355_27560 [Aquisalinus luteolus]